MVGFGETIRNLRESKGIKSKFVADKLGMSASSYCDIESGRKKLTFEHAQTISEVLGVDIKDFLCDNQLRIAR